MCAWKPAEIWPLPCPLNPFRMKLEMRNVRKAAATEAVGLMADSGQERNRLGDSRRRGKKEHV